jgi:CheY-like chemotaxis protein
MNLPIVFLVDDDDIFVYAMKRLMGMKGLAKEIISCGSIAEAISYLKDHAGEQSEIPDIVLCDINLSDGRGWDFLNQYSQLKSQLAKTPKVYMLSSSVIQDDRIRAERNEDVLKYFSKPLSKEDFETIFG